MRVLSAYQLRITEAVPDGHALQVNLNLGSGIVFMDVVTNGWNILPGIRLRGQRR